MQDRPDNPAEALGFDLKKVSWGYRRVFSDLIGALLESGDLGEGRREVTETVRSMLSRSQPGSFDFALKEFLAALNPRTRWLLELPAIFGDLCGLGMELAEAKLAHGIAFFRLWGQGQFGDGPEAVCDLIRHVRALRQVSPDLAQAFMAGYARLLERLDAQQIGRFAAEAVRIHQRSPRSANDFAALNLSSAWAFVRSLTDEARLEEIDARLGRLATAIAGRRVEIGDLSGLDSDEVLSRGCTVVCLGDHLYLPARIGVEPDRRANRTVYLLMAIVSAEAVRADGFAAVHGQKGVPDLPHAVGPDPVRCALTAVIEVVRIVSGIRRRMPGARRALEGAIQREFRLRPAAGGTDRLLQGCLSPEAPSRALVAPVLAAAERSEGWADSARRAGGLAEGFGDSLDAAPRALTFFPDPYYGAGGSALPPDSLVIDLSAARKKGTPSPGEANDPSRVKRAEGDQEKDSDGPAAAFVYPEWNHTENDYYQNWCFLRERAGAAPDHAAAPSDPADEQAMARARRMFERLKPDLIRREKYLPHGDEIDIDRLVEHMALRRRMPAPRERFYQKPLIKRRDLAVALLLDVSGSTAGLPGERNSDTAAAGACGAELKTRIIDLERRAALTLGAGLDALGDRFGLFGFSGSGREHCEFFVYKSLDEPFGLDARARLAAARPTASTRIGVALRHCRQKLADVAARKKVIILITDGRPQDAGYDPVSRYAQYDVRMACQECAREDIHVVGISTLENSRADMEIMFPHRRFVILEDMTRLADVLPALYLKMTT